MTPQETAAAAAMRAAGMSDGAIARSLSPPVTRQHVHAVLGRRAAPSVRPRKPRPAPPAKLEDFPACLRAWRGRLGLSQRDAAEALRIKPMTLALWERRHSGCSLESAIVYLMEFVENKLTRNG